MLQLVKNVFAHNDNRDEAFAIVRWTVSAPPLSYEAADLIEMFDDDTLCIELDDDTLCIELDDDDIELAIAA